MKRLITISFISFTAIAVFAQSPESPENIPTDTMGMFRSEPIISTHLDSSQFSNEAHVTDSAEYEWNQKGKRKNYKRTTTSSSSRTTRKANASNKKYK